MDLTHSHNEKYISIGNSRNMNTNTLGIQGLWGN